MAAWIGIIGYVVAIALILAILEIQIEGKHGWAEKLPCWQRKDGWFVKIILGGRPLTGYHLAIFLFLMAVFHFVFFLIPWNFQAELFILGLLLELILLGDFFWFVLNPHFGLKKFKKDEIWWHKKWLGPVPSLYIYLAIAATILIYLGFPGIS